MAEWLTKADRQPVDLSAALLLKMLLLMLSMLLSMLLGSSASAHNVVGGVYAMGNLIEGEAGFSNGDMAKAGTPVDITDSDGNLLAQTAIDEEGLFSYEAKQRIDHHFHLDMSAGHVLDLVLPADELPQSLAVAAPMSAGEAQRPTAVAAGTLAVTDNQQIQLMIEQAVAKQIKPLRKELAAYKEKASLQDVLGGIGYIFGLCGIGIWLHQRKTERLSAAAKARDKGADRAPVA